MQLTLFTDLGLRVLMYLGGVPPDDAVTIAQIAQRLGVAHNHLSKVVQFMGQQGWLNSVRGKGGGVRLAPDMAQSRLGHLVRTLERGNGLIDCASPPCALRGRCGLKSLLGDAEAAFYARLDEHTLADAVTPPTREVIVRLHRQDSAVSAPDPAA
ncbi:RrF2 family transcriptional regulator [Amphibiibacter pelophylacis]|uniref:Rrf2 family transcriptional regulator n=1 Tax=Amphibiibacter pelophylacis TaxID=1799477 RepID=A0ACC6P4G6_9BURK